MQKQFELSLEKLEDRTVPTTGSFSGAAWEPVAGDWNGDRQDSIGMFDPSTATWYLKNTNNPGAPDVPAFRYGAPGWIPVVGDWDGDGTTTVGVVDPRSETWYLHNVNMQGAPDYTPFAYGAPGWMPLAGNWRGIATGLHTVTRANRVFPVEGEMSPSPDELAAGGCIITFRDVSVRLNEEQETMDVLVPLDLDQALSEMAAKQLKRGPSN